jgi:hypothetical protein
VGRVPPKARPGRQRLLSRENFLQTPSRLWVRSKSQRLVAGVAAPLAEVAAQLLGLAPQQPLHREAASRFLHCRWTSQLLVAGLAPQQPFHHAVAPRFLPCRWTSLRSARNHNSLHKPSPATRASRAPQDRRGDLSGSSSRRVRYCRDMRPTPPPSPRRGNRVYLHLK